MEDDDGSLFHVHFGREREQEQKQEPEPERAGQRQRERERNFVRSDVRNNGHLFLTCC